MSLLALALGAGGIAAVAAGHQKFRDRAKPYRALIAQAAKQYGVSENIIAAILWQESRFNPHAVGGVGEIGMGQFRQIALDDIRQNAKFNLALDFSELYDPEKAIPATAALLRLNRDRSGSIVESVRAYNVGSGNASKSEQAGLGYMTEVMKNAGIDFLMSSFDPEPQIV